jgi:hypothetical protein
VDKLLDNSMSKGMHHMKYVATMIKSGNIKEQNFVFEVLPDCSLVSPVRTGHPDTINFSFKVNNPLKNIDLNQFMSPYPKYCPLTKTVRVSQDGSSYQDLQSSFA